MINEKQYVVDSHYYMKIGLLVGAAYPALGRQLLEHAELMDVAEELNAVLGISITKGMPLRDAWDQVNNAIKEKSKLYAGTITIRDGKIEQITI